MKYLEPVILTNLIALALKFRRVYDEYRDE